MSAMQATITGTLWKLDPVNGMMPGFVIDYLQPAFAGDNTLVYTEIQVDPINNPPDGEYTCLVTLDSTALDQIQGDANYTVVSSSPVTQGS